MRLDLRNQALPWHNLIHLDQEQLLAGLLALTGVIGVGEAHLLHRETRARDRRISPDSGSLLQDFPSSRHQREHHPSKPGKYNSNIASRSS